MASHVRRTFVERGFDIRDTSKVCGSLPEVMGEKRGGARRCGAGQTEDLWRASFNEVTGEAGFESSRTTAPVLLTSELVAS